MCDLLRRYCFCNLCNANQAANNSNYPNNGLDDSRDDRTSKSISIVTLQPNRQSDGSSLATMRIEDSMTLDIDFNKVSYEDDRFSDMSATIHKRSTN